MRFLKEIKEVDSGSEMLRNEEIVVIDYHEDIVNAVVLYGYLTISLNPSSNGFMLVNLKNVEPPTNVDVPPPIAPRTATVRRRKVSPGVHTSTAADTGVLSSGESSVVDLNFDIPLLSGNLKFLRVNFCR